MHLRFRCLYTVVARRTTSSSWVWGQREIRGVIGVQFPGGEGKRGGNMNDGGWMCGGGKGEEEMRKNGKERREHSAVETEKNLVEIDRIFILTDDGLIDSLRLAACLEPGLELRDAGFARDCGLCKIGIWQWGGRRDS